MKSSGAYPEFEQNLWLAAQRWNGEKKALQP
jgi:hypothetical protein